MALQPQGIVVTVTQFGCGIKEVLQGWSWERTDLWGSNFSGFQGSLDPVARLMYQGRWQQRRKSVWFGSEFSHLRHDTHRHTLAHVHVEDLLGLALVGVGSGFWAVVFAPAGQQMVSQPYLFLWCLRTGNVLSVETIEFWKLGNVTALPPCASLLFQLFFLCLTTEKNRSSSKRNELYFPFYKQKPSIWNLETRLQPRRL